MTGLVRSLGVVAMIALAWATRGAAQGTTNPHGASVGTCSTCHLPDAWRPVRISGAFRHAERTFPLDGAHATATCTSCHESLEFAKVPAQCSSCHQDVHRAEFGVNCARCHTTRSFTDQARLARIHEETRFPLRGAHISTPCESCHLTTAAGQPQFSNRPTTCVGCHRAAYDRTTAPAHTRAGFATNCTTCHTETAWRGAPFDHKTTRFPLIGAHFATTCGSCHSDGVFKGKSTTCVSCHRPDYDRTTSPAHGVANYSTDCTSCHASATSWKGGIFNHATTQFPLTGAHVAAPCTSCHGDNVYRGKATTCVSCHRADYDQVATPPHTAAGFSTACASCHASTTTWRGGTFNHSTTRFPLAGAHAAATCASCHADGVYRGKPTTCISCHQVQYNGTSNPPHVAAGYSTDCTTCHTSNNTWQGAVFNHSTTRFPLAGAHAAVTCASCHADGVYRGKPTTCISCHQVQYNGTSNPPHAAAGYSTDCTTCHTSNSTWQGAVFNHSTTRFPLTGAHLAVSCSSCHGDGVYRGKPTACVACHQPDYNRAANPPHAAAGFSTTCTTCHATTTWQGATFNHSTTQFPLTGAHAAVACASCHADGVYRGKPTTCISCHQPDYDGTTNPSHRAASFPVTCASCHTTTRWSGATFDHDARYFPIYSGAHRGRWTSCVDCHTSASDFRVFTCTTCHQQSPTDSDHRGVPGYRYLSSACYTCHPRGNH